MSTMYTLTAMTGREAAATRTVIIGSIEFNWRVWMILLWTTPIAVLAAAVTWPLLGQIAVFMIPLVEGLALFMIHRRSPHGLRLRTYQALWDKKRASLNTFLLCGHRIDIGSTDYRLLQHNTAPYQPVAQPATGIANEPTSDAPVATAAAPVADSLAVCPADPPDEGDQRRRLEALDQGRIGTEHDPTAIDAGRWLDVEAFVLEPEQIGREETGPGDFDTGGFATGGFATGGFDGGVRRHVRDRRAPSGGAR